mmetsp:Transcript_5415/g.11986  ORF Transcript_5415/g.11986 Transcript_5415/m.11986 type:complete len:228 (-) Transcript_5415:297-980(-)
MTTLQCNCRLLLLVLVDAVVVDNYSTIQQELTTSTTRPQHEGVLPTLLDDQVAHPPSAELLVHVLALEVVALQRLPGFSWLLGFVEDLLVYLAQLGGPLPPLEVLRYVAQQLRLMTADVHELHVQAFLDFARHTGVEQLKLCLVDASRLFLLMFFLRFILLFCILFFLVFFLVRFLVIFLLFLFLLKFILHRITCCIAPFCMHHGSSLLKQLQMRLVWAIMASAANN